MKKFFIFSVLILFSYYFKSFFSVTEVFVKTEGLFVLGVILLGSFLLAGILKKIKFPGIIGYMIAGVLIGPEMLNILTYKNLSDLHFLENLAIAFIAISAGGELKLSKIKSNLALINLMLFNQIFVLFVGLLIVLIPLTKILLGSVIQNTQILIGFSILFSVTALAKSPAIIMGIITEVKAKGRITDLVLAITVLKSIIVVMIFPLAITYAKTYLIDGFIFTLDQIYQSGTIIFSSILLGLAVGLIIILFLKFVNVEKALFLLIIGILITELSHMFELEILICAMVAGIVVENFSSKGEELLSGINKISLPLYITFFTFAGASIHLESIKKAFFITMALILLRLFFLYLSNYLAGKWLKEDDLVTKYSWMGFVGQAGIAVGLANIIERSIPGEIGSLLISILIATVVINEFLGPIFFKYLLTRAKEVNV
ncbi:cation:proton antiporter [Calditrichota bacterium GD2]